MKTKKVISNISYNTREFLDKKCKELYDNGIIDFYMYIFHKKEEDELSDHFHLLLYPSKTLDTRILDKEFIQIIIGEELPRKCSDVWKTEGKNCDLNWILYILHDPVYCKATSKCVKKYTYQADEIISHDEYTKQDLVYRAYHETEFYNDKTITDMIIKKNMNGHDLITNGYIPIKSACGYHHYLQMLKGG